MLNRYEQLDADNFNFEVQFGSTHEDFPESCHRPRRPVRPTGRVALMDEVKESTEGHIPRGHSDAFDVETDHGDYMVMEVKSIDGAASITPLNTREI